MAQVIPNISSGKANLIFSSNICFNPNNGLKISIPITNENNLLFKTFLDFNFIFTYDSTLPQNYNTNLVGNSTIEIRFNNFCDSSIPVGIIKPITVNYSGLNIKCYFFAQKLSNKAEEQLLNITVSFFSGEF